jgi:hypothetical protein
MIKLQNQTKLKYRSFELVLIVKNNQVPIPHLSFNKSHQVCYEVSYLLSHSHVAYFELCFVYISFVYIRLIVLMMVDIIRKQFPSNKNDFLENRHFI